jgi:DNA invertase Pin-like site-specific DNA recombinase
MQNTRDFTRHLNSLLESLETASPEREEILEWLDAIRKKEPKLQSKNLFGIYEKIEKLSGILEEIQPIVTDLKVNGDESRYALREIPAIPKVYKKKEAAELLGMSRSTLYERINDGEIKVTSDNKISEVEIRRYRAS